MGKMKDMSCVLLTLIQMGYLDDEGAPSGSFIDDMAVREAENLADGYLVNYGETYGLEFVRDLMHEFLEQDNVRALRTLFAYACGRANTPQPQYFSLLKKDERMAQFCICLTDALDNLLEEQ